MLGAHRATEGVAVAADRPADRRRLPQALPIVDRQLAFAGLRLARFLNETLPARNRRELRLAATGEHEGGKGDQGLWHIRIRTRRVRAAGTLPTTFVRFSNENMLVQIGENVREADVFVIQTSCSPVSDGIIELLLTIDALKHASAARITAVLPYFPYARSDKKDRPRISIAARLMADLIQTAGADRVLTMNLHSPQVQGFFRIPADQLQAAPILCDYLRETRDLGNYVLVAGDVASRGRRSLCLLWTCRSRSWTSAATATTRTHAR